MHTSSPFSPRTERPSSSNTSTFMPRARACNSPRQTGPFGLPPAKSPTMSVPPASPLPVAQASCGAVRHCREQAIDRAQITLANCCSHIVKPGSPVEGEIHPVALFRREQLLIAQDTGVVRLDDQVVVSGLEGTLQVSKREGPNYPARACF